MSSLTESSVPKVEGVTYKRLIGSYTQGKPGPVFMVIGSMHGNEPAGNIALTNVVRQLHELQPPIIGAFHAITGNVKALESSQRFIDRDLNRMWGSEYRLVLNQPVLEEPPEMVEEREMHELYRTLVEHAGNNWGKVHLLDLHTTSATSAPFFIMGDTIRNRQFAKHIPVPIVLGIEEQIEGTLSAFLNTLGVIAINFEGGQHHDPKSVEAHEAAIWLGLMGSGCMDEMDVPNYEQHRQLLVDLSKDLPHVFESRYRYGIEQSEAFKMHPGYSNFTRIRKGESVAKSDDQPIHAPITGRIFMPLYQVQGDDGFFVILPIKPFWLRVSYFMRWLHVDQWLTLLPGVKNHPSMISTLVINTRVARIFPLQFFHLMGYRKVKEVRHLLYMTRRRFDFRAPKRRPL